MEFFEDSKVFVGRVHFGIALLLGVQEANLLEALQLTLNIAWVFLDQFSESADVRLEVRILGIHDHNLAAHSRSDKYVQHLLFVHLYLTVVCSVANNSTFNRPTRQVQLLPIMDDVVDLGHDLIVLGHIVYVVVVVGADVVLGHTQTV